MESLLLIPQVKAVVVLWSYVKKYAWIAFAILAFVFGYMLFKRSSVTDLAEQLDNIRRRHEEELSAIRAANEEQTRQRIENEKKLQQALSLLDESYKAKLRDIDSDKRKEIENILRESGDDPQELAELLAKKLDLQVKM
jgi:hydroxylamine reductase (hybrid-cluster protein)